MGNKGFVNRAKSGQRALPAKMQRIKSQGQAQLSASRAERRSRTNHTEPAIRIRTGRSTDVPALIALSKRTLRACYTPFLGKEGVEGWIASTLDDYVTGHIKQTWIAEEKGQPVGCCVLKPPLLDLLLVDVRRHDQGIGTRLLRHAEELLFETHSEIRLESFAANTRTNRFYAKRGWVETGRHNDEQSGAEVLDFRKQRPKTKSC